MEIKPIAHIHTDFPSKFGIPRQSGLIDDLESKIVFTDEFRDKNAIRGIEEFSHLWLIWNFSAVEKENWSPTVRPPRLGGNERVGVFASRSPYRPNHLGLSSVKLLRVDYDDADSPVIYVGGADLLDGTPIFDIKPYLPISDIHADAVGGFSDERAGYSLELEFPKELADLIPEDKLTSLEKILKSDPRPAYHDDPERIYGFPFAGFEIKFSVNCGLVSVVDVKKI